MLGGIVLAAQEVVGQLGLRFHEPAAAHVFLSAIFGTGTEGPVVKVAAVAVGGLIIGTETPDFRDEIQIMALVTHFRRVERHIREMLLAIAVSGVVAAAPGMFHGAAVVPVAFVAGVF